VWGKGDLNGWGGGVLTKYDFSLQKKKPNMGGWSERRVSWQTNNYSTKGCMTEKEVSKATSL
jgi:hypothetical protein